MLLKRLLPDRNLLCWVESSDMLVLEVLLGVQTLRPLHMQLALPQRL